MELLLRVPRRQFGGDVAEVVILPAFVLINPQAVVVQRGRSEGYIYFIYTNKLFAIIRSVEFPYACCQISP
ncbi:hypothetical protein [Cronobacter dublinensis]|uniref:hypothetical protein n=1 Tax=Cronobacter dublinensis TaxID=413497 RepID=UPI001F1D0D16|nr:hypothetical protein [Cronobacter dublinensis]